MTNPTLTRLASGMMLCVLANSLHADAPAGSILAYEVLKLVNYQQTSSTAPTTPVTDGYQIETLLEAPGSPTDTIIPTPNVTVGVGTAGSVSFTLDGSEWLVESENSSQAALDAEYGNGIYTFNLVLSGAGADSESLSLTADATGTFFSEIPTVTSLTNAAWLGGAVTVDLTSGMATVGFNGTSVTDFGLAGTDFIIVSIEDDADTFDDELLSPTSFGSFTLGSGGDFDLAPGSYGVELEFFNVVDDQVGFGDATGLAGFSSITTFDLVVVPEPSNYALLSGVLACGCLLLRRRR